MYRSSCIRLRKTTISRGNFSPFSCKTLISRQKNILKNHNGRYMSSAPKSNGKNLLYWGASFGTLALLGTSLTLGAKHNNDFRVAVEKALPFTKYMFDTFISPKEQSAPAEETLSIVIEDQLDENEGLIPSPHIQGETSQGDVAVVNLMDTPGISQIDLEVGSNKIPEEESKESVLNLDEDTSQSLGSPYFDDVHDVPAEAASLPPETGDEIIDENSYNLIASAQEDHGVEENEQQLPVDDNEVTPVLDVQPDQPLAADEGIEELAELVKRDSLEVVLSNSCDILEVVLKDALSSQSSAAGLLHSYVTQYGLSLLVPKDDPAYEAIWNATVELEHRVQENINAAKAMQSEVNSHVTNVKDLIPTISTYGASEIVDKAEQLVAGCDGNLARGETAIQLAVNRLNILLDFHKHLQLSGNTLKEHLKDFAPDFIKLLKKEEDLELMSKEDALLFLSLKRPELILAEVEEEKKELAKKFEEALEKQKDVLAKAAQEKLMNEIKIVEENKGIEMNMKIEALNHEHDIELEHQMKLLTESHEHQLECAINNQKLQLNADFQKELDEKLTQQDEVHHVILENNLARLEGIQSKIAGFVELGQEQERTQQLWVAAQSLNSALDRSLGTGRTRSLMPDISIVLQYGENDDFLENVVASVSKTAATMGVIPEKDLLQRFSNVKRACKRVAMVSKEGGSFLSYSLSYIKSFFVISQWYRGSAEDDIDLEKLGPYEILEKADYYVQQGNLAQAAKFMSQLKGVPRKMSTDWMNEVYLLLETKQAAEILLAYAASLVAGFE